MEISIQNGWLFYSIYRIRLCSVTSYFVHDNRFVELRMGTYVMNFTSHALGALLDEYFKANRTLCEQGPSGPQRAKDVIQPET